MEAKSESSAEKEPEFYLECGACGHWLPDWVGSTPCCGSVGYVVRDGKASSDIALFASINDGPIVPVLLQASSKSTDSNDI